MTESKHRAFLTEVLKLAEKGRYTVAPNPMVACLLVKDDKVLARGWHQKAGEPHAEILALREAGAAAQGATAYLNLEPCGHHGRTPPCTEALIKAGIKTLYVSCLDPNPLVAGKGVAALLAAGIEVKVGLLEAEAKRLNDIFFHYIQSKHPFVIAKWALSLDGRMSTATEDSRQISSPDSHNHTHQLRAAVAAILIGSQTAILDDPRLTARIEGAENVRQPLRIVLTSQGNLPLHLKILKGDLAEGTLVVTTKVAPPSFCQALEKQNVKVLVLPQDTEGRVDLLHLLNYLGKNELSSLLVEGGRTIHDAFLKAGLINKIQMYLAPTLIGTLTEKRFVSELNCFPLGPDFSFTATL